MHRRDFYFDLPASLIAQFPSATRSGSRLLVLNRAEDELQHLTFKALPSLLNSNDLLVFNNTKVIPARVFGQKSTGGQVECLLERLIGERTGLFHIRASKSPKPGTSIFLDQGHELRMMSRDDALFACELMTGPSLLTVLQEIGHIPLPPYIERSDESQDQDRYQTVYAKPEGAVAAPTAGLHFDQEIFSELEARQIETAFLTLHVGAGTFQPVRVDDIRDHKMHSEFAEVPEDVVAAIEKTRERGGRVIAVGTTTVRSLETAALSGTLKPFRGDTDIFITPGYQFKIVDAMLTNFHLPESTLMMLISAYAGRERILSAYQAAIESQYRFFSYGDAMLLL